MADRTVVQNAVMDSTRWDRFAHRPGDILVCTPPKCGTTWTQAIVASLLWPAGDVPGPVMDLAPWWDANFVEVEEFVARLEAQTFRRSVKTHLPVEAIPWWDTGFYIAVFRDGRDAFMSYVNHLASFRDDVLERLNAAAAAKGLELMPTYDGDLHALYAEWIDSHRLPLLMLSAWWARRHLPNVLLVHFNDLKADLDGEMRRIAAFLHVPIDPSCWPDQVARCTFEAMKHRAPEIGRFPMFVGGGESFLHKGTNGRWRDVLTADELALYDAAVAKFLSSEQASWLERGSLATGRRPEAAS